jgi:hypothetical protein
MGRPKTPSWRWRAAPGASLRAETRVPSPMRMSKSTSSARFRTEASPTPRLPVLRGSPASAPPGSGMPGPASTATISTPGCPLRSMGRTSMRPPMACRRRLWPSSLAMVARRAPSSVLRPCSAATSRARCRTTVDQPAAARHPEAHRPRGAVAAAHHPIDVCNSGTGVAERDAEPGPGPVAQLLDDRDAVAAGVDHHVAGQLGGGGGDGRGREAVEAAVLGDLTHPAADGDDVVLAIDAHLVHRVDPDHGAPQRTGRT